MKYELCLYQYSSLQGKCQGGPSIRDDRDYMVKLFFAGWSLKVSASRTLKRFKTLWLGLTCLDKANSLHHLFSWRGSVTGGRQCFGKCFTIIQLLSTAFSLPLPKGLCRSLRKRKKGCNPWSVGNPPAGGRKQKDKMLQFSTSMWLHAAIPKTLTKKNPKSSLMSSAG